MSAAAAKNSRTTCCQADLCAFGQCHDCPAPRYLPSEALLAKLGFWHIGAGTANICGVSLWRRPLSVGYTQVALGVDSGRVVLTDNYPLEEGGMMKETYHRETLATEAQFLALLQGVPTR